MFIDICSITLGCDLCCIPSHLPRFPHPGWLRSHGVSNLLGRWEGAIPSTNQREMWLETPRPLQWLVKRLRGYTCYGVPAERFLLILIFDVYRLESSLDLRHHLELHFVQAMLVALSCQTI